MACCSGDTEALLKEIRSRYQGKFTATKWHLSQTCSPNIVSLSTIKPQRTHSIIKWPTEEEQQDFNGQGLHILAVVYRT